MLKRGPADMMSTALGRSTRRRRWSGTAAAMALHAGNRIVHAREHYLTLHSRLRDCYRRGGTWPASNRLSERWRDDLRPITDRPRLPSRVTHKYSQKSNGDQRHACSRTRWVREVQFINTNTHCLYKEIPAKYSKNASRPMACIVAMTHTSGNPNYAAPPSPTRAD